MKIFSKKTLVLSIGVVLISGLLFWHNVPRNVNPVDRLAIHPFLEKYEVPIAPDSQRTFEMELQLISTIQKAVNAELTCTEGLPLNQAREPRQIILGRCGACYDRARLLEKTFRHLGLECRHLSLFARREGKSKWSVLTTKGSPSHAMLEVRTQKGWLLADPVFAWIAVGTDGRPFSFLQIKKLPTPQWRMPMPEQLKPFIGETPGYGIYGLYSRHGRFFPPYNCIPDYNIAELLHNLY